jgi:DHA1 family multidrug resistance protein-like MFS transporter
MVNWKRNLVVIWLSQLLSIMGFAFALPFVPYYLQQDLGVDDPVRLKMIVALFGAGAPLTLAVFAPIWGGLADRYGRRIMLLRANFGGAIVLLCMGLVNSVSALIVLRLVQGVMTGTVTAAQTMASVHTPKDKNGLALGALSAAVYSGSMLGAFCGGLFADLFGYRRAFYAASGLLLVAALLVMFCTSEDFVAPAKAVAPENGGRRRMGFPQIGPALPILLMIMAMAFARQFDMPMLPLLVQDINGGIQGAASITGSLSAFVGIAGLAAGLILGRIADRIPPPKIAKLSSFGAGLFMIPQGLAHGLLLLFGARFGMIFCAGGLDPVFQVWLAKVTPEEKRGSIFGWAATAKATGWIFAPLVSGGIAAALGVRAVYLVGPVFFFLLIPMASVVARRLRK